MSLVIITIAYVWLKVVTNVDTVTPNNPCDPMRKNTSVKAVIESNMLKMMMELNINRQWLTQPMRYVNCSKRGLDRIPSEISKSVQILDLSSNVISEIRKKDLEKFQDLQIFWLYSNCIGDLPYNHFYCKTNGIFEKDAFSVLLNLKLLDIGGNALMSLPINLTVQLEYLDVSRSGIQQINAKDLSYLENLLMFDATNLCFLGTCKYPFHIDNNTFQELPLRILLLSENQNTFHLLSYLNSRSLEYVNFAQTQGDTLRHELMKSMISVKRLDLYLLNPNTKIRLKVLNNSFNELLALEHLNLASNMIDYLPKDIFEYNKNLSYLDLSGNCLYLSVINPAYVPDQIKFLYLGYNYCLPNHINNKTRNQTVGDNYVYHAFGPTFSRMEHLTVLSYAKPKNLGRGVQISTQLSFHEINNNTLFNLLRTKTALLQLEIKDSFIQHVDLTIVRCFSNMTSFDLSNNMIGIVNVSKQQLCSTEQVEKSCAKELNLIFSYNKIGMALVSYNLVYPQATRIDLQFNLISSIHDEAFKHMPCLTHIDLRNNPITFIHLKSFKNLLHLNNLYISSMSLVREKNSFAFLKAFTTALSLHLSFLGDNLFDNLRKSHYHARSVIYVDLSNNQIPSTDHLALGLKAFPNTKYLILKQCSIRFSDFFLPTPFVIQIDLSQNQIQQISKRFVQSVPRLKSLKIDQNEITDLEIDILDLLPDLETVDLSQNYISQISINNKTTIKHLENLKVLKLQNNYIFELSLDVFSFSFLSKIEYLDLRWNSIECYCEMAQSFGRWLSQGSYRLSERPGFLPQCSYSLQRLGGCVTCAAAGQQNTAIQQPLVQIATKNLCLISFHLLLTTAFTTFFLLFTSVNSFISSSKGMLWLAKFSTRKVRSTSSENEERNCSRTFAFHAFVMFDTEDEQTGDWVDDHLIPQLTLNPPYMEIALVGRDDQCGIIPAVTQHLRNIEASRKVIIIMTGNYWQSYQGKYMLSAIENLYYQTGHDRTVIVTFESDRPVGGLLQSRRKNAPLSVLQYPSDLRYSSIFWESLRHSLV